MTFPLSNMKLPKWFIMDMLNHFMGSQILIGLKILKTAVWLHNLETELPFKLKFHHIYHRTNVSSLFRLNTYDLRYHYYGHKIYNSLLSIIKLSQKLCLK